MCVYALMREWEWLILCVYALVREWEWLILCVYALVREWEWLNLCVYALKLVINSLVDRMGGEFNDFNTG